MQFPIDLTKSRSKRDRDRAPRTRRSEAAPVQNGVEADDDGHSTDTTNKNTTNTAASRVRRYRPTSTSVRGRSPNVSGNSAPRGGRRTIGASRPSNGPRGPRNALNYADYPTEFRLANKLGSEGPPYLMPYMGTFYYDGVPSYKTDSLSITDAIKKQM